MLHRMLSVLSVGLVFLGLTLATSGVLLPSGHMIDLGGIGAWSFRLLSGGLEVSHNYRILFIVNPFAIAVFVIVPPAFYVAYAIERERWARKAFPVNND